MFFKIQTVREIFSVLAIILTLTGFFLYIRSIVLGIIQPHMFTWIIWSFVTFTVCLAQIEDGGGVGAWPIGVSGILTIVVAIMSLLKRSDLSIRKIDIVFFVTALLSLPLWYFTSDPLWTVILLSWVDVCGFVPTIRKAYHQPFQENLAFFTIFLFRNLIAIAALEHFSMTTVLFPAAISLPTIVLIGVIFYRRRVIKSVPFS